MKYRSIILDYVWISVASILTALAVNMFFQFTGLAPGGITGLAIVFSTITGIPVSYMTLAISIPLLVAATFLLGKSFGIKTLFITLATPVYMQVIPAIHITEALHSIHPILELVVAGGIGGILVGLAIGIALNHDCATGGTDVIALLIQYFFKKLPLSKILLFLDGFVVIASGIITENVLISVFSFLSLLVIIQTIQFTTSKKLTVSK